MSTLLRFDGFGVDVAAGRLFKHGSRIRLREQSFQVLAMLLEHPGDVVTREDLRRRLWPADIFVDFENNLNAAVARLREGLGDSAERPRFIETLPRRGYRFIGTASASDRQVGARCQRRWRPAAGREVPATPWVLEERLGEGGFGKVWLALEQLDQAAGRCQVPPVWLAVGHDAVGATDQARASPQRRNTRMCCQGRTSMTRSKR